MSSSELDVLQTSAGALSQRYSSIRQDSVELAEPISPEDGVIQSMPDVSPTRWHLAHTTWFFETFVLKEWLPGYVPYDEAFETLFNSYYNGVGTPFPRERRGQISRPGHEDVLAYRRVIDARVAALVERELDGSRGALLAERIELGLQHEQQHQELILMDIKHVLSRNPLHPVYRELDSAAGSATPGPARFEPFAEGLRWIGGEGPGFRYDNEGPRHRVFVHEFELADRTATNGEFQAFIEDGGYSRPELWLADGWSAIGERGWSAPLYWTREDGRWWQFTLGGRRPIDPAEPVCHVSYYEADAFARWSDARLPTEAEWEAAAEGVSLEGRFARPGGHHPRPHGPSGSGMQRLFGDVWEWTASDYAPYPGFRAPEGAIGEYNGKFMCNQRVLRGGSCVTREGHVRRTYRNFFYPHMRWQFGGIRLAR